jgi:tetratricopeptide (TPR) repeat protein
LRRRDNFNELSSFDYATNAVELITRLSKLGQFGEASKIVDQSLTLLSSCADMKEQRANLKELKNELTEKIDRLRRVDTEITPQIEDARKSHLFRKLYLYLGDRGKERLQLGLGGPAIEDFEEQRKIGENELKCLPEQLSKVYANLGKSYQLENRLAEAEQYLRKSLKNFNGSNEDKCEVLKAIFEVLKFQNYGNHFRRVYTVLDDINNLAVEMEDLDLQQEALENMRTICVHFGKRDELRIVEVRLKRVQLTKSANQDSIPDSDEEGYVQPQAIAPVKDAKRPSKVVNPETVPSESKRRRATFASLDGSQISERQSPIAKKKNPVIIDSSQDSDSFLEDFRTSAQLKRAKREYSILTRNLISSSLPDEVPFHDALVPPRPAFNLDLNEYDRTFVNQDEIDDVPMTDTIVEVSDQQKSVEILEIEETIPATPSFGTDSNEICNDNDDEISNKKELLSDAAPNDVHPVWKPSPLDNKKRIPLAEIMHTNGTPPIPHSIEVFSDHIVFSNPKFIACKSALRGCFGQNTANWRFCHPNADTSTSSCINTSFGIRASSEG